MKTERLFLFSCLLWFVSSNYCIAQNQVIDTIFIADYENNQTNSGFTNINPTNASATDAVYMVSGNESNYAVAHKVDRTDNAYFSNGSFRSESDVLNFSAANYFPGDHFRYEFSVYLKDWEEYTPGAAPYGNNIFQMKETAGVVTRIATKRNGLFVWEPAFSQNELIKDIRPYINQWIDFRIDVLWTKNSTGYIKYYIRFPGDELYTLVRSVENVITYYGTAAGGQRGYFKWGVYREANSSSTDTPVSRIAYHDNIKLFKLDYSSLKTETINEREEFLVKVHPNPTNGNIMIDLPVSIENADIYIYSLDGKTLLKKQLNRNEGNMISIAHFNSGLYFLKIVYGGASIVKKIIKK
tara:strand:+ start:29897 stop:30958 length:1062 start_codon:yes stop_codon:yes gene_type:complete